MKEDRINEVFPPGIHPNPSQFPLVFSLYLLLLSPREVLRTRDQIPLYRDRKDAGIVLDHK